VTTSQPPQDVEETSALLLDFDKLQVVAATGQAVVPVVLQNSETRDVLFVGYANRNALEATLQEQTAVLWSTSRNELWRKGATSGDWLRLVDVRVNCEQNSLLYLVTPATNGVCHTKASDNTARPTCYYRSVTSMTDAAFLDGLH